jgi:hypothetical protein
MLMALPVRVSKGEGTGEEEGDGCCCCNWNFFGIENSASDVLGGKFFFGNTGIFFKYSKTALQKKKN